MNQVLFHLKDVVTTLNKEFSDCTTSALVGHHTFSHFVNRYRLLHLHRF